MTIYEQRFAACIALAPAALHMRKPGDWFVDHSVEIKNGVVLESRYGNGETPEEAINQHWVILTSLAKHEYLVINAYGGGNRRAVRWNGFMWEDVTEPRA